MKNTLIFLLVVVLLGLGIYFISKDTGTPVDTAPTADTTASTTATSSEQAVVPKDHTVIGQSVQGRDITAYHYGSGDEEILLIGGIHGGYEWNTVSLAYQAMDYFKKNEKQIPSNLKITIIPVLNPDGLNKTLGTSAEFDASSVPADQALLVAGRFNGNNVDLSRNFDCRWKSTGTWQNKTVSAGTSAFSEPESQALRDYVNANQPKAVIVWYSAAGGVYSSSCGEEVASDTKALTEAYAKASKYPAHDEYDFYEVTGDAVDWMAKQGIPAISVLLTDHQNTEWAKNLAGIKAVFNLYGNE